MNLNQVLRPAGKMADAIAPVALFPVFGHFAGPGGGREQCAIDAFRMRSRCLVVNKPCLSVGVPHKLSEFLVTRAGVY